MHKIIWTKARTCISSNACVMIFSGSSKLCNILFKFDFATLENRSNKFMCNVVVAAAVLAVCCSVGVPKESNVWRRRATKLDRENDVVVVETIKAPTTLLERKIVTNKIETIMIFVLTFDVRILYWNVQKNTRLIAAARGRRLPLYNLIYIFNDICEHFYDMQRHMPQRWRVPVSLFTIAPVQSWSTNVGCCCWSESRHVLWRHKKLKRTTTDVKLWICSGTKYDGRNKKTMWIVLYIYMVVYFNEY